MVCSAVLCSVEHVRTPHARAHRLTARLSLHARRPNWRKCASCARSEACVHPCVHVCGVPCFHIQQALGLPVDAAPSAGASSVAAESESVTDLVSSILGPAGARAMRSCYCICGDVLSCLQLLPRPRRQHRHPPLPRRSLHPVQRRTIDLCQFFDQCAVCVLLQACSVAVCGPASPGLDPTSGLCDL